MFMNQHHDLNENQEDNNSENDNNNNNDDNDGVNNNPIFVPKSDDEEEGNNVPGLVNEGEEDENSEFEPYNPAAFENNNQKNIVTEIIKLNVSSEGVMHNNLYNMENKNALGGCLYCNKYYSEDMLVPADKKDDRQCYHCLFWMNYSVENRKHVDGVFGMTIVDYINKCKDIHEMDTCIRKSDSGGCFLCEFNMGLPVTDVKDLNKLYYNSNDGLPDHPEDDEIDDLIIGMNSMREENLITIDI